MVEMKLQYKWDEQIGPILYLQFDQKTIGFCLCHRRKDRSVRFFGLENYLCARCLGIWLGAISGILISFLYLLPVLITILLLIPMIVDGLLQLFRIKESNNFLRMVTGYLFGLGLTSLLAISLMFVMRFIEA